MLLRNQAKFYNRNTVCEQLLNSLYEDIFHHTDEKVYAHKCVLAARCPALSSMLSAENGNTTEEVRNDFLKLIIEVLILLVFLIQNGMISMEIGCLPRQH